NLRGDLAFLRTPYPAIATIFFVWFALSLFELLQNPNRTLAIRTGLLVALNAYTYVHAWTLSASIVGTLIVLYFIRRWAHLEYQRDTWKYLAAALGISLVGALPVLGTWALGGDVAKDVADRFAMGEFTRSPDWVASVTLLVLPIALFLSKLQAW